VELGNLFLQNLIQFLKKNIDNSLSYSVKSANLETLCWCLFLFGEVTDIKQYLTCLFDFLSEKSISISKESAIFFQSCLDMWCLLITRIDKNLIVDEYLNSLETIVRFLLSDYELSLRLASGETLALISSIIYDNIENSNEEYTKFYFNGYFDVSEVEEILQTTNEVQNRKISKKDREKQRHSFKEVLHTFQTGESPTEELTVSGNKFIFNKWADIKLLECYRNVLGSGFLLHLQHNPIISHKLGITIENIDKTTAKSDKQLRMGYISAGEKDRTQKRNLGRNAKIKMIETPDQELSE